MIEYLSISDVARALNVTPGAICNWRTRDTWPAGFPKPAAKVGDTLLFKPAAVEAYVRSHPPAPHRPRAKHENLPKRDREIRRMRAKGETYAAIGERFDLSRQRVAQVLRAGLVD
jgi:hypothetical protein